MGKRPFTVTFEFPERNTRDDFIMWIRDCGGEQIFRDCYSAEDISFNYPVKFNEEHVKISIKKSNV